MPKDPRFQKSKHKKQYDAGHVIEFDEEHKKRVEELSGILDKSTDFLSEKDIANIKKILSKLSKKLLDELKQALINKQMSQFRNVEVLHEGDNETR